MSSLVIELRAGEGGDDAEVFCTELFAAVNAYARQRGDAATTLPAQAGSKTLTIEVAGPVAAYGPLAGVHRVQRIPKNSTRRHTSTATIAVLTQGCPVIPVVRDDEVVLRFYRGSGPGGQHRNKTNPVVTHMPVPASGAR
jgi:protein subunit release factor A